MSEIDCEHAPDHLGNPSLVKWGSQNVGNNTDIKVPFVSKDVEYLRGYYQSDADDSGSASDRWMEKEVWTLSGELINCEGYEALLEAQEKLIEIFKEDWQELKVGAGNALKTLYYGRVRNISFGESDYRDDVPYEVVIEGYRNADEFGEDRAVINPIASYTWSEAEDATMELRYEVSAEGIVTSDSENNALENAKNFVHDYLAAKNKMYEASSGDFQPYIIYKDINTDGKRYLVSDEEKIDRVRGTYGIVRIFKMDQTQGYSSSILRYTTESSLPFGETKTITFSGEVEIGYRGDVAADADIDTAKNLEEIRKRYQDFKDENLFDPDDGSILYKKNALSEKVDEDILAGLLRFTLVFGSPEDCIDDYDVSVEDSSETSLLRVNVNGQAKHRGPCDFEEVKKCFYGDDYASMTCKEKADYVLNKYYDIAYEFYREFLADNSEVSDDNIINKSPLSMSINEDKGNKVINYSLTFDDRISHGAHSYDYTLSVTAPVQQVLVNSFQEICTDNKGGDAQKCGAATPPKSHHYQDIGIARAGTIGAKLTIVGESDEDDFKFLTGKAASASGTGNKLFLTKKQIGGDQRDEFCSEQSGYKTLDCSWINVTKAVANSSATDRTKVTKFYLGN